MNKNKNVKKTYKKKQNKFFNKLTKYNKKIKKTKSKKKNKKSVPYKNKLNRKHKSIKKYYKNNKAKDSDKIKKKKQVGGNMDFSNLKKEYNNFGLLTYQNWYDGKEYIKKKKSIEEMRKELDCNTGLNENTLNFCTKCKEKSGCKCYISASRGNICTHEDLIKTFKDNEIIEHENFDGIFVDYKIEYFKYLYFTSNNIGEDISILILSQNDNIYVLFPYSADFEISNIKENKSLIDIINIINLYAIGTSELYLFGHSQGATMIRYLLHIVDEFTYNNIHVRLSGIRFNKEIIPTEDLNSKIKSYYSINFGFIKGNVIFIDRFDLQFKDKIEEYWQDKTLFCIKNEDNSEVTIYNLKELKEKNKRPEHNLETLADKNSFHILGNIFKFLKSSKFETSTTVKQ